MGNKAIFFKKDDKVYEARIGATMLNRTDNTPAGVVVKDMVDRGDGRYGILLLNANLEWDREFEVESLEDLEF